MKYTKNYFCMRCAGEHTFNEQTIVCKKPTDVGSSGSISIQRGEGPWVGLCIHTGEAVLYKTQEGNLASKRHRLGGRGLSGSL